MSKKRISVLILVLLLVAALALTFTSCKKKDMELTAFDVTVTYDGAVHHVEVSSSLGDTSGWSYSYINDKGETTDAPVNAGTYAATVTYSKKGYVDATATATLTIFLTADLNALTSLSKKSDRRI